MTEPGKTVAVVLNEEEAEAIIVLARTPPHEVIDLPSWVRQAAQYGALAIKAELVGERHTRGGS